MTDSQDLLAEYRRKGSDAAFRELAARFVDLVYSTALRLVERGVRVVQCYHGDVQPWDSHNEIEQEHRKLAGQVDRLGMADRPFVLLDLGIAFAVLETTLTVDPRHRLPPGTLPYLAPEMLQPNFRDTIDYRSDLYAAALTIYECAAGRHPFAKKPEDMFTTLSRVLSESPPPLNTLRNDLTKPFCQLVDSMLKKIPALRPANLTMLIRQLEQTT